MKYLDSVAEDIAKDGKVSVDLIIGGIVYQSWSQPVLVKKRKISKDGGPFALHTTLGWCILGPIECI